MNQAQIDPVSRRVTEGYGILQPRVSVTMASAAGSLFARIYAGHTGVDPYTTAVSDLYQDLFDEGIFTGKGLYDVDAFMAALENRVPENAVLSHDLFEGLFARTALVSDVEVVDDYPSSVLAHARRQHRWVSGDWQILLWLFPFVPTRTGLARNRLPLISRWKILDNLRRSLVAPATVALFLSGWTYLPGSPTVWTLATLAALTFSPLLWLVEAVAGPRPWQPWRRAAARPCRRREDRAGARVAAAGVRGLPGLPDDPRDRDHDRARGRHASQDARVADGRDRRVSARSGRAHGHPAVRGADAGQPAVRGRRAGRRRRCASRARCRRPCRSCCCGSRRRCSPTGSASPSCARRQEIRPDDRQFLRLAACKTWRYFDTFAVASDHGLPPDNVQEAPELMVAHRTSPTNIGMSLLAALAARDLGFIRTSELVERVDATLTTIEGLERFEGHLFNWYDSQTLAPLAPRYISSVDSGNLAAALLTLASGLRETIVEAGPGLVVSDLDDLAILLQQAIEQADVEHKGAWPEARSFRESVRTVRAILSGRASLPQKRENLSGALAALADAPCRRSMPDRRARTKVEIAYWAGRLRRRRRGGRPARFRRARSVGDISRAARRRWPTA